MEMEVKVGAGPGVVPQQPMFMISLTILFHSGMSRFTDEHVKKLRLFLKLATRILQS